jgi:purine-binding chemotaxis protein CheW
MTGEDRDRASAAARLAGAFDRSFAEPLATSAADFVDLLAIRVAGEAYALRVRDLIGIATRCAIVTVPATTPDLVGIAHVRGQIVPVFDLAAIAGHAAQSVAPLWIALCGDRGEPIGLGLGALDGHIRVSPADIHTGTAPARFVHDVVRTTRDVRAIFAIPDIAAAIRGRSRRNQEGP